jgi:hypothetical protein
VIREVLGDVEQGRDDALGSVRPALQKLSLDAHDLIHGSAEKDVPGLKGGFSDRAELIQWEQQLAIRSLGEVPMFLYQGIASQLASANERPIAQALIAGSGMNTRTAEHWRTRVRERVVLPAFDRAFRQLRTSATEYATGADEDDAHQPLKQRYIAMRPGLDELNKWQRSALDPVLSEDGFEDGDAILDWLPIVVNATHGEEIRLPDDETIAVSEFVARVHDRDPWRELMTDPERQRIREVWAARFLIPTFNAGVRELLGTSGEVAQIESENRRRKKI